MKGLSITYFNNSITNLEEKKISTYVEILDFHIRKADKFV